MNNPEKEPTTPAEYMDQCRVLARQAKVNGMYYQLWPSADRRPEELKQTLDFDEALKFLNQNPRGAMQVLFNWEMNGKRGKAAVEYLHASFPMATEKFIWEMLNSLITAKIADELFKDRYPDPEWLE